MKKLSLWLMITLSVVTSASLMTSCSKDDDGEPAATLTTDPGVVINGVKWATRNVDVPGTFAYASESYGKFYQWNSKAAWSVIDNGLPDWNSTDSESMEWTAVNDPSPAGWRVPTREEQATLLDRDKVANEWTTQNGLNGRRFTDRVTGASLFLPATGYRSYDGGKLSDSGTYGYYWSNGAGASYLRFNSDYAYQYSSDFFFFPLGPSVRPVAVN